MQKTGKQTGFTLVELMVVIAVLAVLAVLAYPSYRSFILTGRMENARETVLRNVRNVEQFYGRHSTVICGTRNVPECAAKSGREDSISAVGPLMPPAFTPNIKGNAHTGYYEIDISPVAGPGGGVDSDNYLIFASPNNKVNSGAFSSSELANSQIYMVYFSDTASFVKCTRSGLEAAMRGSAQQDAVECAPW